MIRNYNINNKAFTLIELAIVMVIMGILLGIGTGMLGILVKRNKYKKNEEIVKSALESVLGYTKLHGHLPDHVTFYQIVRYPRDVYSQRLFYFYYEGSKNSCSCQESPISIKICHNLSCSNYDEIQKVSFVIISKGENRNLQVSLPNTPDVSVNFTIKVYDYGLQVDDYQKDFDRKEDFDDIVVWMTTYELLQKADCKLLKIITTSLPNAILGVPYNAILIAEGGLKPYKWQISCPSGVGLRCIDNRISGIPRLPGNFLIKSEVIDQCGNQDQKTYSIAINPQFNNGISFPNPKPRPKPKPIPIPYRGHLHLRKSNQGGSSIFHFPKNKMISPKWLNNEEK